MSVFKTSILMLLALGFYLKASSQTIRFDKIEEMQRLERRPVLTFISTDWCSYCHSMKNTMLHNPEISTLLSQKFYTVFLNAEEKEPIRFAGRNFQYKPTGKNTGLHELAEQLGTINGEVSYPSLCFLNDKNEIIYQYAGYLEPKALTKVLKTISAAFNN